MTTHSFTLRSDQDLIATFRKKDQNRVVLPRQSAYPFGVQHYFTWSDPSGVYTYLVFKRRESELPLGIAFLKNGAGSALSPAGMCDWCHSTGASDEIGLLTTSLDEQSSGGTWLCLDLSCLEKIRGRSGIAPKKMEQLTSRLMSKLDDFYQRVRPTDGISSTKDI